MFLENLRIDYVQTLFIRNGNTNCHKIPVIPQEVPSFMHAFVNEKQVNRKLQHLSV